jgi:leucyl aminopeptidase
LTPWRPALGGRAVAALNTAGEKEFVIWAEALPGMTLSETELSVMFGIGAGLRAYRFDKYKTKEKPEHKPTLKRLNCLVNDPAAAKKQFESREKVVESVNFTRDLVSEPANVIYPVSLAAEARKLSALGVKVEVLGEKEMKRLGMGALLGVGQGSARESQLVTLQWRSKGDSAGRRSPVARVSLSIPAAFRSSRRRAWRK